MKKIILDLIFVAKFCVLITVCKSLPCSPPPKPSGALYSPRRSRFYAGEKIYYSCKTGFTVVDGSYRRICLRSGEWSGFSLRCVSRNRPARPTCTRPSNPPNGVIYSSPNSKQIFEHNELIWYQCNSGYELHGASRVYCYGGRWSHSPTCNAISYVTCPHRNAPKNLQYAQSQRQKSTWYVREIAIFVCDNGYTMLGSQLSICLPSGRWSDDMPQCNPVVVQTCPHRAPPQHGSYIASQSRKTNWKMNDVAIYRCDVGYALQGENLSRCLSTFSWSTNVPTCRSTCPNRPAPENGAYTGDSRTTWMSEHVARFVCNEGHLMVGSSSSKCRPSGLWTTSVPKCLRTCPHRSPPLYGKYTRVQLRKTTWLVNDEAVYVCKDGYVLSRRGNPRCLSTGRWSHDIPVCEKRTCAHRRPPLYGGYSLTQRSKRTWFANDEAHYICNDGYVLTGSQNSRCMLTGSWSSPTPTCRRQTCLHRFPPQNGRFTLSQRSKTTWFVNDEATYVCDDGFVLTGGGNSRCMSNGNWSSDMPACRRRTCPHRRPPQNGVYTRLLQRNRSWNVNDQALFICNDGYMLKGSRRSRCRSDGSWSTDVPVCDRLTCPSRPAPNNGAYVGGARSKWYSNDVANFICSAGYILSGRDTSRCLSTGNWTSPIPICRRTCPSRRAPNNGAYVGQMKPTWLANDRARFICDAGYELYGSASSTCRSTGEWDSDIPMCRRACLHRNPPTNGVYTRLQKSKRTWFVGDAATFICNNGFILSGSRTSICLPTGRWSENVPTCGRLTSRLSCPHRPPPAHGAYIQAQQTTRSWFENDVASYQCDRGYAMLGNTTSRCGSNGQWNTAVPTCRQVCPHRQAPAYGSYVNSQSSKRVWNVGDTALFICRQSYEINRSKVFCLKGGVWSAPVPVCKLKVPKIVCALPRPPSNGRIRTEPQGEREFKDGEYIYYECNNNYRLVGERRVRCNGRKWSSAPTCQPTVMCPHRNAPQNGIFVIGGNKTIWYAGESARFLCKPGFYLIGSNHVTCQTNSIWSAPVPTCQKNFPSRPFPPKPHVLPKPIVNKFSDKGVKTQRGVVTCPHRLAPAHGIYIQDVGKRVWRVGDIARYRCDPNFILVGHDYVDCRADGTWRFDVPTCQDNRPNNNGRSYCIRPPSPKHGFVHSAPAHQTQFFNGDYITFTCNAGFALNGPKKVRCWNKVWEAIPFCIPINPPLPSETSTEKKTPRSTTQSPSTTISPGTCQGQCGTFDVGGCSCDSECEEYFDCCSNYQALCINSTVTNP